MKQTDLLKFAVTGLLRRKARTFLTVLGVIIGTICIVLMIAIGLSSLKQTQEMMLMNEDLLTIQLSDYSSYSGSSDPNSGIKDETIASIAGLKHVTAASPVIEFPIQVRTGRYEATLHSMQAVDPAVLDLEFSDGGMFPKNTTLPYIVLNGNSLSNFQDPENPPSFDSWEEEEKYVPDIDLMDAELEMKLGYDWESDDENVPISKLYRAQICGITKRALGSYNDYIPLETAKRLIAENREWAKSAGVGTNSYTQAIIKVDEVDNVEAVLDQVKKLGFETYSPTSQIKEAQEASARQQGQLFAIGFISLLVSAIGIANTMYANILERRREIGVMKVLGMKISKIRQLFILEAALIGLLGGLVGLGISYLAVLFINTGTGEESFMGMYFYGGMNVEIPLWLSLAALGIALGTGVISGIYPAHKATKMSALEAMRNN